MIYSTNTQNLNSNIGSSTQSTLKSLVWLDNQHIRLKLLEYAKVILYRYKYIHFHIHTCFDKNSKTHLYLYLTFPFEFGP
jgi:hypothetical protein